MALRIVALIGRIEEVEEIKTLEDLTDFLANLYDPQDEPEDYQRVLATYTEMLTPLNLKPGTYMVTGIEGKFCDGYGQGQPWPLVVTPNMSVFDIMVAVAASEANGYPDINHVWFEAVDIDDQAHTMHFSMGS